MHEMNFFGEVTISDFVWRTHQGLQDDLNKVLAFP